MSIFTKSIQGDPLRGEGEHDGDTFITKRFIKMNPLCPGIKQESALVFLVLLSFIPLMLMGFVLDILLVHFFSMLKGNIGGLNAVSLWVYTHLAGYRFLPQELMAGFWFLMIISFIVIFSPPGDPLQLRFRFLFSFLFLWVAAVSTAGVIVFACIKPFDLLLARVEETTWVGNSLSTGLAAELAVILFLPIAFILWKKTRAARAAAPSPPSPDASTTGNT